MEKGTETTLEKITLMRPCTAVTQSTVSFKVLP